MPADAFEIKRTEFLDFYNNNRQELGRARDTYANLIDALVASVVDHVRVESRVKDRDESLDKFKRKYMQAAEASGEDYHIKDYITDLIGVRVICYYEDEILKIVKLLEDNFIVVGRTDKTSELACQENAFGYKGYHLDLQMNALRSGLDEYKKFETYKCEVQIRTILQHAWSVLDHKIKYKKTIPHELKRKINAFAASFEVIDDQFINIRDKVHELEKYAEEQLANDENNVPIDSFSLKAFIKDKFNIDLVSMFKIDDLVNEIVEIEKDYNMKDFSICIDKHRAKIEEFAKEKLYMGTMSPLTIIRHCLYKCNKEKFKTLLFSYQLENFNKWEADHDQPELP